MLMDGIHTRMGGTISDKSSTSTTNANMTSNLAFEEKDNAVDIVTQVDEGQSYLQLLLGEMKLFSEVMKETKTS